ncbi:S-layer homology domain-containing protein [Salibacterium salarium]|nr:S-layer homology domain-containing protein [Salibacterium salarium]
MKKIKQMMVPAFLISLFVPVYASAESDDFRDVEEDYWAADEINYLADKEIVSGYDDASFRPSETVIRSQAASMIVKALDLEIENRKNPDFSDVSKDFHAYDVVAAVWNEEIISGRNGAFMPMML